MKKINILISNKTVEKIARGLLWFSIALILIAVGVIIQALADEKIAGGALNYVVIVFLMGIMLTFSIFLFLILVRHPKLLMQNLEKKMYLLSEEDRKFHIKLRIFALLVFFMLFILGLIDLIFRKDFIGLAWIFMGIMLILGELIRWRREK